MGTLLLAAGSVLVALPMVGWVARDADLHHRRWFGWAFLVGNTSFLGLLVWLFVRRREPGPGTRPLSRWGRLLWLAALPVMVLNYLIAAVVVTFLFQVARVDGSSMAPTLRRQDRVIVSKLAYLAGAPQRGDIVMYRYPLSPEKTFVQRVIAKSGDTVRIVAGRVFVNDVELPDPYVPAEFRSHEDWGPEVVGQGYFVMGDHRNNSADSRHWGMVPARNVLGKVVMRLLPVRDARVF